MDSEIIKSFLVSVGVTVNESDVKKFEGAIASTTKTVAVFAAAMSAAAAAVSTAVVKISGEFEDLYYASQRLRASAQNIKAFDYGVAQMGGTAKNARASLEGLASFMRSNPGGEGFLASLGVSTRDAGGNLRDTTDTMRDLGEQFRKMPYFLAKIRAGLVGIDEETLQALIRGTDLWSQKYRDMAADIGVDFDAATEASTRFMQSVRELQFRLQLLLYKGILSVQRAMGNGLVRAGRIAGAVFSALSRIVERFVGWIEVLDRDTAGWSTTLTIVAGALGSLITILGPAAAGVIALATAVGLLIDDFNVWRGGGKSFLNWSQWSGEIEGAIGGINDLMNALGPLITTLSDFAKWMAEHFGPAFGELLHGVLDGVNSGLHLLADNIRIITALLRGDWAGAWKAAKQGVDDTSSGFRNLVRNGRRVGAALIDPQNVPRRNGAPGLAANDNGSSASGGTAGSIMNYFQRMGWTREQAAGITANLQKESSLNPGAVGDGGKAYGLAQWHPDRQAAFKQWAGKDIRQSTLAEQLAFVHYELTRGAERAAGNALRGTTSARAAGAVVSSEYERPRNRVGEMIERGSAAHGLMNDSRIGGGGGRAVSIKSESNITIHGATDPKATGKAVERGVDSANGKMLRQTQGAVW